MKMQTSVAAIAALFGLISCVQGDCITTPTTPECADYNYNSTALNANVKLLCDAMPYMPGCGVMYACNSKLATGKYCNNMSIALDICLFDAQMDMMKGYAFHVLYHSC